MARIEVSRIRNFSVVAHGGAGKTSLVEAMLFNAKATDRMGSVEAGNTVTDFEPEDIDRKITISSSVAYCDWNNHRLNIIDTPGFINFLEDTRGCLRVSDGAVIIVSPLSGVKSETEKIWDYASEYELPRIVFVNKMDRENASFSRAVSDIEKSFESEAIPLNIPIGEGPSLEGIVDILNMKAYRYSDGKKEEIEPPSHMKDEIDTYRKKLVEKIAEADDELLERYLEGGELTDEEIFKGVKEGSLTRRFVPVLCGAATQNLGVDTLMDSIMSCLASPDEMARIRPVTGKNPKDGSDVTRQPLDSEPQSAFVFKTVADPFAGKLTIMRVYSGTLKADSSVFNSSSDTRERIGQVSYLLGKKQVPAQVIGPGEIGVVAKLKATNTGDTLCDESNPVVYEKVKSSEPIISYAIDPKSKGDEEKVSTGLQRILEEDPTLKFHRYEETKEMIISGMGQVHIEVALQKLKRKFGVEVDMKTPKIPFRETIRAREKAQGRYKKQSGGRGQYGDCWIEIEPLPPGQGFEFVDKIVGGVIPKQYIPAVEKGVVGALKEGILAGYAMVDLKVTVYDGSYHSVDSSEMAFKIAGSLAIKKAAQSARPVILEPIMTVEVITPEDTLGSVIGDLNAKRGKVLGVESQAGGNQKIGALLPIAEILTYANQLQSLTSGRGYYTMEFSKYEELPAHLAQKLIDERKAEKESGKD
jgi:elongation factor G